MMAKTSKSGFDVSLWKQALKVHADACEDLRQKVFQELRDALCLLSEKYDWDDLYIFGSILNRGGFSERSDVDIALGGLNKFQHYRFVADISMILNREVDVVLLEDCPFAETIQKKGLRWKKEE